MALDKTFSSGEILSAGDVNGHLLGLWIPIDKRVIASGSPVASASFQSLDSNFRMFRLTFHIIPAAGATARLLLNNDSGSNYHQQTLSAFGSSVFAVRLTPAIAIDLSHNASGGQPIMGQALISKPLTSVVARATMHLATDSTTAVLVHMDSWTWNNTASLINRIDLNGQGGSFSGVVSLEGMRGV
ncbi:hypothetical protein ACU635_50535 [[Actinomadura] parvosata]|uniref:hypothetical protein n=1 Tax=[Actinomadura] parvosata TaxID=1955412 RepID=UPI00406C13B7